MSNRGKIFLGLKDNGPDSHLKFPSVPRQQEELGPKEILGSGGDKSCVISLAAHSSHRCHASGCSCPGDQLQAWSRLKAARTFSI